MQLKPSRTTALAALLLPLLPGAALVGSSTAHPQNDGQETSGAIEASAPATDDIDQTDKDKAGPGPKPADVFHPDGPSDAAPLFGGRVIVHMASLPKNINYVVENSAWTRRILYDVTETLLIQDWEYHDYRANAASGWVQEDLLVLNESAHGKYAGETGVKVVRRDGEVGQRSVRAVYGKVTEGDEGWLVTPASVGSDLAEPITVAAADVDVVEKDSVFTFTLRDDVRWHPSAPYAGDAEAMQLMGDQFLDAQDVQFSWSIYSNPTVDCDEKRFQYEKITDCRIVDEHRVRFFYQEQYAFALTSMGDSLTLLPSHIYNLGDPQNPRYNADASSTQQGDHINDNPHNQLWVGLGPYRMTKWSDEYLQAERFVDGDGQPLYFNAGVKNRVGYFDTLRWRYISDDKTAFSALINDELDFFDRVKSADYFGESTRKETFTKNFYKGYRYLGTYGYTGWNLYRPALADINVRRAIAHAFDFDSYLKTTYKGLARQTTGPVPYISEGFPRDLKPYPYDVDKAIEILEEAGWYDRDGDGIADKDGVDLKIEFLFPTGNDASVTLGLKIQESLEEIGIQVSMANQAWATFLEKMKNRDFDAINLAWVPPLESDPEQLWHSKWGAKDVKSSNNSGLQDPEADRMILGIQRETDRAKRMELWKEFHRYIYQEVQPYLFGYNVPQKYALAKRIRGMQAFAIDPGYSVRRWYFIDPEEPGVRANLTK